MIAYLGATMKACAAVAVVSAVSTGVFLVCGYGRFHPAALRVEVQSQQAANGVIRVTCVGDSITIHACASNDTMPYPQQLGRILGPSHQVSNLGDSGKTMMKRGLCGPPSPCSGDCSYWNQPSFQRALSSDPDIVTIMLGTNDAKRCNWDGPPNGFPPGAGTNFAADYLDMMRRFRSLPTNPKVYVVLPPPLTHPPRNSSLPPPFDMSAHVVNVMYPALQRSIAMEGGADGIIDVWTALGGEGMDPKMTCDGCHPVDQALTVIAETIAKAIVSPPSLVE